MTVGSDKASDKAPAGRGWRMAVASALVAATLVGPADAAAAANTFNSEWADATWTPSGSGGNVGVAQLTPGEESHNGTITELLTTRIVGVFCSGGASSSVLVQANLLKTEQATDLAGVVVDTFNANPTATVNRTTSVLGTITTTPTRGENCGGVITGLPVTTTNPTVTLTGSWVKQGSAALLTYSGTDCGGTGTCRYADATATGSFTFGGTTINLGGGAGSKWLWSGSWDLDAMCSPVPGYPCS